MAAIVVTGVIVVVVVVPTQQVDQARITAIYDRKLPVFSIVDLSQSREKCRINRSLLGRKYFFLW